MGPSLCFCDMVFTIKCAMRVYVRCRSGWRSFRGSCPQMTCGWQGLCQTGRQVALGFRSRTWVLKPCCTGPSCAHTQTGRHAHPEPAESQRWCAWGCLASQHAASWKWHVSLRRGTKKMIKKKKVAVFQPQMAGWVQNNKGLMVWTSVPGFKEEYICMFTRPLHTEMSNYFWIAVICRAL